MSFPAIVHISSVNGSFFGAKCKAPPLKTFFVRVIIKVLKKRRFSMLKIAICDDNLRYRQEMESNVKSWAKAQNFEVEISVFDHGDALLSTCQSWNPDIILLDIMMPLLSGMDTAREIRKRNQVVKIIFFTSAPEFAVESYDVKASGYLLKPLQTDKFRQVMNDCISDMQVEPEHLIARTSEGYQKILLHHIDCIEAQNKKLLIHLDDHSQLEVLETFSHFTQTLPADKGFFKCHRSYMVFMPNIDQFTTTEITTKSGIIIPIARSYTKAFKDAYFHHMFEKGE